MPVISTRYSTTTTTGNSYISPASVGTYRSTLSATNRSSADRASSIERPNYTSATESYINRSRATTSTFRLSSSSSYRLTNGTSGSTNDSYSSRYGVSSNSKNFSVPARFHVIQENLSGQSSSSALASAHLSRCESRTKSDETRSFLSCKECTATITIVKNLCNHHHLYHHTPQTQHHRSSSLARSVAISGLELYEKYSPANYTPKSELTRSSSLSDSNSSTLQHSITTTSVNNNKESSPVVGLNKVIKASSNSSKENNNCCDTNTKSNINKKNKSSINNNNNNCLCHHHHSHCKNHPSALSTSVITSINNPHISNSNNNSLKTTNNNHTAKNIQEQSLRHTTTRNKSVTHSSDQTLKIHTTDQQNKQKQPQQDLKNVKAGNAGRTSSNIFDRHSHTNRSSSCSSAFRRQSSNNSSDNNNSIMPSYTHSAPVQGNTKFFLFYFSLKLDCCSYQRLFDLVDPLLVPRRVIKFIYLIKIE